MKTFKLGVDAIPFDRNSAITVGTFDGVHVGHKSIFDRMQNVGMENAERLVVVTFDPHPQIVLQKEGKEQVSLLTTIEERCELFEKLGIDATIVIPFTVEFSKTPAEKFIREVIVETIGVNHFFIGHDHMFGRDRGGDEELLKRLANEYNFHVEPIPPLEIQGIVVSSTKVRNAIKEGDVEGAARMLGRPYNLTGNVVRGDGRGRTLGIPTANVVPLNEYKLMPGNGVYIVTAEVNGRVEVGMSNIGVRPTFTSANKQTLEIHFLDVDADLYDKVITVQFQQFIRHEQKFGSKEEFLDQLLKDRQQTTQFKHNFINGVEHGL